MPPRGAGGLGQTRGGPSATAAAGSSTSMTGMALVTASRPERRAGDSTFCTCASLIRPAATTSRAIGAFVVRAVWAIAAAAA
jgi:hypothetical protein